MTSSALVLNLSDGNFEAEIGKTPLVLVDFWASWCGPCRALAPVLEELASESEGKFKVAKVNVDEEPNTAAKFGVRSLPTLLLFKGGKVVDQIVGAVPKTKLESMINAHL